MYGYLEDRIGATAATAVTALIYAAAILLTLYCALEPQAEFNYIRL